MKNFSLESVKKVLTGWHVPQYMHMPFTKSNSVAKYFTWQEKNKKQNEINKENTAYCTLPFQVSLHDMYYSLSIRNILYKYFLYLIVFDFREVQFVVLSNIASMSVPRKVRSLIVGHS